MTRLVVYGAGAVGGTVGARLFEQGHDVVLIARSTHGEVIATDGLRLEAPTGTVLLPVPVVAHPSMVDWRSGDVVLLAVKTQDTRAALDALDDSAPPEVPVVCLQNGVESEGADEVAEAVAGCLRSASFLSESRERIMRWKYRKLLRNLNNAVEAVLGPDAGGGEISRRALAEGEACCDAAGIDRVSEAEWRDRLRGALREGSQGRDTRPGGSSWQSLERRTGSIETDYLTGEIVLLGRLHGVPTPVNALLVRFAGEAARERRSPGFMPEESLLALLGDDPAPGEAR